MAGTVIEVWDKAVKKTVQVLPSRSWWNTTGDSQQINRKSSTWQVLVREQLCHKPCGQGQLQSDPSLRSTPRDPPRNMVTSFVRSCPEATDHPPPNLEGAASEGSFWSLSLVPKRHGTSNLAPLRVQLRTIRSSSRSMEPTPPRQGNLPLCHLSSLVWCHPAGMGDAGSWHHAGISPTLWSNKLSASTLGFVSPFPPQSMAERQVPP